MLFSFWRTLALVIKSYADKLAEKILKGEKLSRKEVKALGDLDLDKAQQRLAIFDQSTEKDLLTAQALHYHKLKGSSFYSIDADSRKSRWRIVFAWADETLTDVSLVQIGDTH